MEASDLDDGVKLTQAGMAFGTPIYMAPEQALGNPMDGRADLYAAAVLGYEMLCGQPPFYSDDKLEVMSMHTARPVPSMRQKMVRGGRPVPPSIERLVVRGLTKKPSDRYATADEFLAEVEHALRTPEGGVTEVVFDRPGDTGSHPLVSDDGEVRITGATDFAPEAAHVIADAIDEALSAAPSTANPVVARAVAPASPAVLFSRSNATPRGGVGLGLPYTGPEGQPIFGLTPEQRLAGPSVTFEATKDGVVDGVADGVANALEPEPRAATIVPRLRKRLGLYLVVAACAISIGVVVAVITANANRSEVVTLDPATPAGAANAALEHGDPSRALQILEANQGVIGSDARAQLVLGHVRASRNESGLALAAYEQALTLDPELEHDDKLRAALRAMAGGTHDYAVVAQALDLWVARTKDPEAKALLLLGATDDNIARRRAMRPVIERRKLADEVDWLKAYSLDLEQDTPCRARREAVSKLRALGDARAVPALQRANTKVSRAGFYGNKRIKDLKLGDGKLAEWRLNDLRLNDCLSEDATAAIGYLRGLSPK
jgi:hypothetical protein